MNKNLIFSLFLIISNSAIAQTAQDALAAAAKIKVDSISTSNSVYLDQQAASSDNIVTVDQRSGSNSINGVVNGELNFIAIGQNNIDNLNGKNLVEFEILGNFNSLNLTQTNLGAVYSANYGGVVIHGNENFGSSSQTASNNAYNSFFVNILGNNNSFDITQNGIGGHVIDITLTGNNHSIAASQSGSVTHKATLNLSNVGGPGSINITQQGNVSQTFNIIQQCANILGCNLSVTQGTP
jgi:hypothetical protein